MSNVTRTNGTHRVLSVLQNEGMNRLEVGFACIHIFMCIYIYTQISICIYIYIYKLLTRSITPFCVQARHVQQPVDLISATSTRELAHAKRRIFVGFVGELLFHVKVLLWESITLLLPPPTCKAYPIAILLHDHCALYAPPPTPPCMPYNIHYR